MVVDEKKDDEEMGRGRGAVNSGSAQCPPLSDWRLIITMSAHSSMIIKKPWEICKPCGSKFCIVDHYEIMYLPMSIDGEPTLEHQGANKWKIIDMFGGSAGLVYRQ